MTADLTPSDVFRATGLQVAEIRRLATGHGADLYLADLAGGGERGDGAVPDRDDLAVGDDSTTDPEGPTS